jgi:hypothetical protein
LKQELKNQIEMDVIKRKKKIKLITIKINKEKKLLALLPMLPHLPPNQGSSLDQQH